jgi:hypothetical protein
MENADDITLEELKKIAGTMYLQSYTKFLNLPRDEMYEKAQEVLKGIGKKEFLTVWDIDEIGKFLGPELWAKFKKLPMDKRVEFGEEILKKINKGE